MEQQSKELLNLIPNEYRGAILPTNTDNLQRVFPLGKLLDDLS